MPGCDVLIGPGDDSVVFDWQPTEVDDDQLEAAGVTDADELPVPADGTEAQQEPEAVVGRAGLGDSGGPS